MSEIPELLASVREKESRRTPRGSRIALTVVGIGIVATIAAGATLAVSATASIAEAGLGGAGSEPAPAPVADVVADFADAVPLEHVTAPAAPAAPAAEAGPPIYDASTDIATIPRPPADWPAELGNSEVWLEQQGIIADCMLDQGYEYHFTAYWLIPSGWLRDNGLFDENVDGDITSPKGVALYGPPDQGLGEDYDWRTAGCVGYAVHVTGMDDAN